MIIVYLISSVTRCQRYSGDDCLLQICRVECQIKIDLESDKNLSKISLLHNLIVEYCCNTLTTGVESVGQTEIKKVI